MAADVAGGVLLLTASLVFAGLCWGRSWLLYPNYNHLSWAWAAALLAAWGHLAAAALAYLQVIHSTLRMVVFLLVFRCASI